MLAPMKQRENRKAGGIDERAACTLPSRSGADRSLIHPHERCVAQFDRVQQALVKPDEHRHLQHHRQAPAERVHLVAAVQLHDLLVHLVAACP